MRTENIEVTFKIGGADVPNMVRTSAATPYEPLVKTITRHYLLSVETVVLHPFSLLLS